MTSASTSSNRPAEVNIQAGQPELNNLPFRRPPALAEKGWIHGFAPQAGQVRVVMRQSALVQVRDHSQSNTASELGGVLLGHAYQHEGQIYLDVAAALPAVTADRGPIHFTFTADAWSQLHRDRAVRYAGLDIVGWFHTHPNLGVFYSSDDLVVHSAAFVLPWHVGLVVDPVRNEAAVFGWVNDTVMALAGFYELLDDRPESVVAWRGVRTEVYRDDGEPMGSLAPAGNNFYTPRNISAQPSPWLGVAVGGVALLFSLLLLLFLVAPLLRQVNNLEGVATTFGQVYLQEAQTAGQADCPDDRLQILTPLAGRPTPAGIITIIGTADHPSAVSYQLQLLTPGASSWATLSQFRRNITTGRLAEWDASLYAGGDYQLKLVALDRNETILNTPAGCTIHFQLEN